MVVGKSVIVAGIGSRKGVSASEVLAAIDAALAAHGLGRNALSALATTDFKREETGIFEAGRALGLEVVVVEVAETSSTATPPSPLWGGIEGGGAQVLKAEPLRTHPTTISSPPPLTPPHKGEGVVSVALTLTHSPLSLQHAGVGSVSEVAALIAAGHGARLLGPRIVAGSVTCALATTEPRS
jgi:cobalt-precorrin 5A hydrolase